MKHNASACFFSVINLMYHSSKWSFYPYNRLSSNLIALGYLQISGTDLQPTLTASPLISSVQLEDEEH